MMKFKFSHIFVCRFVTVWALLLIAYNGQASLTDGLDATYGTFDNLSSQLGAEKMVAELGEDDDLNVTGYDEKEPVPEADQEQSGVKFKVRKIILEGNTVIRTPELKHLWKDIIKRTVSFADLKKVADAITNYYRKKGYFLSYALIPVQEVDKGKIKIMIIEGYIDTTEVVFEDDSIHPSKKLAEMVKKIKDERPLNQATFERYISLIRDLYPYAKGYLQPSEINTNGAAELQVVIPKQAYFDGQVTTNNFGTDTTGPWMMGVNLNMPAPWQREDKMQARYNQGTYYSELHSASLGYTFSLGSEGTTLGIDGLISRSNPTGRIKDFDVVTREDRATVTLLHPFMRSREANLYGGLEFSTRNQLREVRLQGQDTKKERSRTIKLVTIGTLQDDFGGNNAMRLSFTQGLRMMNSVDVNYINRSRTRGSADHSFFEFSLSRLQHVKGPYAVGFYIEGQYANATLLDINRYRSNGFPYNGAYPVGTLSGDSGIEGKIEFNYYNYDIDALKMLRVFAYLSKVKVWNRHPKAEEQYAESAKGIGGGVQAVTDFGLSSTLQYGYPLDNPVGNESINPTVGFNVNYKF